MPVKTRLIQVEHFDTAICAVHVQQTITFVLLLSYRVQCLSEFQNSFSLPI